MRYTLPIWESHSMCVRQEDKAMVMQAQVLLPEVEGITLTPVIKSKRVGAVN